MKQPGISQLSFSQSGITLIAVTLLMTATGLFREARRDLNGAEASPQRPAPRAVGRPSFMSPHATPIAARGGRVFVVNTPADTVDVVDAKTRRIIARVPVGVDPVSLAIRPDGKEVWVSNHVSDSVSVIDVDPSSPLHLQVVATIQDLDPRTQATRFDEPVGIAFASNKKAYVALSSENQIAVVDAAARKVVKRLRITAQDPRAITVRNGRLYVLPFESNNQTQLSGGTGKIDGNLVTFNAYQHSIANNNVLSLGHVVDIVKHPRVPDRDLYVFDAETDEPIQVVNTLGTLLYGLAVDSQGNVFVAQADARNDANGRAGTKKHGLKELENRAFLNRITHVPVKDGKLGRPRFFELEPLPPKHPSPSEALATPFAIQVSDDDRTLVASAASSDVLFTVDAASGRVLGRVQVGSVPRGIALDHAGDGQLAQAWVLNAVENSVSLVDLADRTQPKKVATIALEDPTHPTVKRGRIAFNTAKASTTHTFSCASCHPDGHTDQLLWVLKTPIVTGGNQIMPRSTMPIRGLRDTAPFHWDGIPGDPYGGNNSANIHGSDSPNSDVKDPRTSTRHLIDGGLAATMARVGDKTVNDEGKAGLLSARERDDMATFLLSVPYPPAPRRPYTNQVSDRAKRGFKLFHIEGDLDGKIRPNVCGNCHRMPFLVSTNTPGTGMDAPTWRGAYDRFLILPQGRLNIIDFDFYRRVAEQGQPERNIWQFSWGGRRRFDPIWDMVLEGSTGYPGAFARQITLNRESAAAESTGELLDALETAAREQTVVLEVDGVRLRADGRQLVSLQFDERIDGGGYVGKERRRESLTRKQLVSLAAAGKFVGTVTARHGARADVDHPQPALWTLGPIEQQRGRQKFPILHAEQRVMTISGRHLAKGAFIVVDGRRVGGRVMPDEGERVKIELAKLPAGGMHLLQVQNPGGLASNDFIFHVVKDAAAAVALQQAIDRAHVDIREKLANAIAGGDMSAVKRTLGRRARRINERNPRSGSTPLSTAALHGRLKMARYLLQRGARVDRKNRDGNTPLHVAAFLCRDDVVKLLLDKGASPNQKNARGETPVDVVSSAWNDGLADFYRAIGRSTKQKLDLDQIRRKRPQIAAQLRSAAKRADPSKGMQP